MTVSVATTWTPSMQACRAKQCKKLRKELSFPRHGRINHQHQQGLWRTEKEQYEMTELAGYREGK